MRPRLSGESAPRAAWAGLHRVLALVLGVLLVTLSSGATGRVSVTAAQEPDSSADMLILLDVTRSMAGAQGSRNIWVPIRTAAENTISATASGTRLAVVP